jgi:hypothetical protein
MTLEFTSKPVPLTTTCCGIRGGFHRDDLTENIRRLRPQKAEDWFAPGRPPAVGLLVKIAVWTDSDWDILTGRITEAGEGVIKAKVELTSEGRAVPSGPYFVTLTYDESMQCPWALTAVELVAQPSK